MKRALKRSLRATLRNRRRALSADKQEQAARALKRNLVRMPELLAAKRIAFYVAQDGEIDPAYLMTWSLKANKHCYLPILASGHHEGRLWFGRVQVGDRMRPNRFGIPEPTRSFDHRLNPWTLDVVLLPLVGFDESGHRLGMGGGFYDRSLAFERCFRRPWLIGIAHRCQRTDALPADAWDIGMDAIATDEKILRFTDARVGSRRARVRAQ